MKIVFNFSIYLKWKILDLRHGQGVLYLKNTETKDDGEWRRDKYVKGTLFYEDGTKYRGSFKENLRNGNGSLFSKEGNIIYKGMWKMDLPDGYGIYHYF